MYKLPGVKPLIKEAVDIYKAQAQTIILIMLTPLASIFIFGLIISLGKAILSQSSGNLLILLSGKGISILLIVIALLSVIYIVILGQLALLFVITKRKSKIGVKEAYMLATKKLFPLLWISLLSGLATVAGLIFFIVPGIIIAIWFSLAPYILVAEDIKGVEALKASKAYVSGFWWALVGRMSLMMLIFFALILGITLTTLILGEVGEILGNILVNVLSYLVLSPIAVIFIILIYENLKAQSKLSHKPANKTKAKANAKPKGK